MCVLRVSILSLSTIFLLDFGTVPEMAMGKIALEHRQCVFLFFLIFDLMFEVIPENIRNLYSVSNQLFSQDININLIDFIDFCLPSN